MRKKHRVRSAIIIAAVVLIALYIILVNFLVSAALVPDFMKKLDAFESITRTGYAQQVKTDDIILNHRELVKAAGEWEKENEPEIIYAVTEDGFKLDAAMFRHEGNTGRENSKWVLLLHGYTGWKEEMYPYAMRYYEAGYDVIVPDLRCQGQSEGDFIGMGWTDHFDCMLWLERILDEDPEARIVIHGQSMGAAAALMMTGEESLPENVKAVISDCSYTDAYSMFEDKIREWFNLPAFPLVDSACIMLRLRGGYDLMKASALEAVKKSSTPTLFIHGIRDKMISCHMSELLYEAETAPKEIFLAEGAGHAQAVDKDPEKYFETIERFVENYL